MPLALTFSPTGPKFSISTDAVMPGITATAALSGVKLDPKSPPIYTWTASLTFNGSVTPHGTGRTTAHSAIAGQVGVKNTYLIPFKEVRGGVLIVTVSVKAGNTTLTASSKDLTIIGTNPTPAAIKTWANSIGATKVRFRKQMRQESSLGQFTAAGWPKYSSDNMGGVGLCQLTDPAPSASQTWHWKENVQGGWALYRHKETIARNYPTTVRNGPTFRALVVAWNSQPSRKGKPTINVTIPEYTADQLELDTIRGFNGFAGGLHEFRVRVGSQGLLVVTLNAAGTTGAAEWERVPVSARGASGDPNYVINVEAQADFQVPVIDQIWSRHFAPKGVRRSAPRTAQAALLCAAAGLLAAACSPAPPPKLATDNTGPRFLYVVNCDARVDKLDLAAQTKAESFLLSERSGSPPAIAVAPDSKMDGCLVQRVVADSKGEKVSLIAPKRARLDGDGLQEFQALTFGLPEWRLTALLAAGKLPEAPRLELGADGSVHVPNDEHWTPVTLWDLSKYQGQNADAGGLLLASSGSKSLLSLLSVKPDKLALGVADPTTLTVARLNNLPVTTLGHAHLAPGGGYVLVEATESAETNSKTTGALKLYDATGNGVAEWQDAGVRNSVFVALTPNGDAVYRSDTGYHFIAMGRHFGTAAVIKPLPELAEPGLVFAAK